MSILGEAARALIAPVVALLLAGIIGQRISVNWAIHQKRRELQLESAKQFYQLYGDFFTIWKLWNSQTTHPDKQFAIIGITAEEIRWDLLQRAAEAEGRVESIIVKMAAERPLSRADAETLGQFRQAYQQLRENIRDGVSMGWSSSSNREYIAFKELASHVAVLLSTDHQAPRATKAEAAGTLRYLTDNYWGNEWLRSSGRATKADIARPEWTPTWGKRTRWQRFRHRLGFVV